MKIALLMLATLIGSTPVKVSTLDGETFAGELQTIKPTDVLLKIDGKPTTLPIDQVTSIVFKDSIDTKTDPIEVQLLDGSNLSCTQAVTASGKLRIKSSAYGELSIPLPQVSSVRFANDPRQADVWAEYTARQHKRDLLVIRKKDGSGLDHSPGVVASIGEDIVAFVLGGDEIPLNRKRIFGIVFSRSDDESSRAAVRIKVGKHDKLSGRSVVFDGEFASVELMGGVKCRVPSSQLAVIDLSSDKIVYLSDLEPRVYEFEPFFGESEIMLFRYRRDETEFRRPIRLAGKTYKRGLSIHSRTTLSYRLTGEFRRFQTLMGIDYDRVRRRVGHVHIVISGDGRTLFDGEVDHSDEPVALDLNVTDVRDLKILVDFGEEKVTTSSGEEKTVLSSMGDWLDLANARVIK